MPQYRVTLKEQNPLNPGWDKFHILVKAVSANHAMRKANAIYSNTPAICTAIKAVRYDTDHAYWRKLWKQAYDNMPVRTRVNVTKKWQPQRQDTVTVPEYIKAAARGRMKQDADGHILKLEITKRYYRCGQLALLTRLLQYAKNTTRGHSLAHRTVAQNMARGSRPRQEWRCELLKKLASKDGTKIALELSGQRFQPVKLRKV